MLLISILCYCCFVLTLCYCLNTNLLHKVPKFMTMLFKAFIALGVIGFVCFCVGKLLLDMQATAHLIDLTAFHNNSRYVYSFMFRYPMFALTYTPAYGRRATQRDLDQAIQ